MDLVLGSQKFTVKPHLLKRCGTTDNITFGAYKDEVLIREFYDLEDMGMWITSIIIDETWDEELVK